MAGCTELGDTREGSPGDSFCMVCGMRNCTLRCSGCRDIHYCGKDHQIKDWPKHKTICADFVEARVNKELLKLDDSLWVPRAIKPFNSIVDITDWNSLWKHVSFESDHPHQRLLFSQPLSWPLTLVSAIQKFKLDERKSLLIHVLGTDSSTLEYEYYKYLKYFHLPDIEIYFVGPELLPSLNTQKLVTKFGKKLNLSFIADVYHSFNQQPKFSLPDLIIAHHPRVMDDTYPWAPTVNYVTANSIPSVFTSWSKDDFEETAFRLNFGSANVVFKGPSTFPSSLKFKYMDNSSNELSIGIHNAYWVGFKGQSEIRSAINEFLEERKEAALRGTGSDKNEDEFNIFLAQLSDELQDLL